MKNQGTLCLFLIILTTISVLIAGCTSNTPEPAPANLPTSAHAIKTPFPTSTTLPEAEETYSPEITQDEEVTALSVPANMVLFEDSVVSIHYPDRFSPISDSSLERMRSVAQQQGIEILTILTTGDSKDSIQITRQAADASIEGIFNEKRAIANEVALNGSANVIAMTFVKYDVEKQTLADGTGVVKVTAKNLDNGTAVTYLLCTPGMIYNINFIYDSPERAEDQATVRDAVIQTLQVE